MLRSIQRARLSRLAAPGLVAVLLGAATACIVDHEKRCSANEEVLRAEFGGCVCEEGAVLNAKKDGCTKCGEHESVINGACACSTGYARVTPDGACTASMLGATCSASSACAGDYPYCAAGGYCTKSECAVTAGLNIRPIDALVVKFNYTVSKWPVGFIVSDGNLNLFQAQIAWAF